MKRHDYISPTIRQRIVILIIIFFIELPVSLFNSLVIMGILQGIIILFNFISGNFYIASEVQARLGK